MADTPTRTDTPPPPPPKPPESLKPSPEMQQKLDTFRAQKEARQDAGQAVDHRAAKAENQAAREASRHAPKPENQTSRSEGAQQTDRSQRPENVAPTQRPENVAPSQRSENVVSSQRLDNGGSSQRLDNGAAQHRVEGNRPPQQRVGEGDGAGRHPENAGRNGSPESPGLRPSPEFQQKLDTFRAQKEARQDAGQAVDHRAAKAENQAAREAAHQPRAEAAKQQPDVQPRPGARAENQTPPGENRADQNAATIRQANGADGGNDGGKRTGSGHESDGTSGPKTPHEGGNGGEGPKTPNGSGDGPNGPGDGPIGPNGPQGPGGGGSGDGPNGPKGPGDGGPGDGGGYHGPERRQYQAKHLDPAHDLRRAQPPAEATQEKAEAAQEKAEPRNRTDYSAETGQRLGELRTEGHGPQRHHDITADKMAKRLGDAVMKGDGTPKLTGAGYVESTNKIDPETNSTRDADATAADPNRKHRCEAIASRMDSGDDYVNAEKYMREHVPATGFPIVRKPISEVLGPDAHQRMSGVYLDPAKPGQVKSANFEGGNIVAVYNRAPNGDLTLRTMFPEPPSSFRP